MLEVMGLSPSSGSVRSAVSSPNRSSRSCSPAHSPSNSSRLKATVLGKSSSNAGKVNLIPTMFESITESAHGEYNMVTKKRSEMIGMGLSDSEMALLDAQFKNNCVGFEKVL